MKVRISQVIEEEKWKQFVSKQMVIGLSASQKDNTLSTSYHKWEAQLFLARQALPAHGDALTSALVQESFKCH